MDIFGSACASREATTQPAVPPVIYEYRYKVYHGEFVTAGHDDIREVDVIWKLCIHSHCEFKHGTCNSIPVTKL